MLQSVCLSVYPMLIAQKQCILRATVVNTTHNKKSHDGSRTHWSSQLYGHQKLPKQQRSCHQCHFC